MSVRFQHQQRANTSTSTHDRRPAILKTSEACVHVWRRRYGGYRYCRGKVKGCRAAFPIRANRSTHPSFCPASLPDLVCQGPLIRMQCRHEYALFVFMEQVKRLDRESQSVERCSPGLVVFEIDEVGVSLNHHLFI